MFHFPHLHPGLTSNAQGEVLAAAGLAKGIVGTAGVDTTMLRAGRPQGQVPLFAADCVVALTLGERAPISEPLVGGPVGPGGQQQGGRGTQVASGWDTESEDQGWITQFTNGKTEA